MPKRVKSETHMQQKLRYNSRARKHACNGGSRWCVISTSMVMESKLPDRELAKDLGRSIQAVQAKRYSMLIKKGGISV